MLHKTILVCDLIKELFTRRVSNMLPGLDHGDLLLDRNLSFTSQTALIRPRSSKLAATATATCSSAQQTDLHCFPQNKQIDVQHMACPIISLIPVCFDSVSQAPDAACHHTSTPGNKTPARWIYCSRIITSSRFYSRLFRRRVTPFVHSQCREVGNY